VANVAWCNGYPAGFSFIDLPAFGDDARPRHVGASFRTCGGVIE
jgi:hypothetical protein